MTDSNITVTVLRSTDGLRHEVILPHAATLDNLKSLISTKTPFGPIEKKHQRLFHLGREFKSGKRSLVSLGFGNYENFLVHLHSTQPKTFELMSSDDDKDDDVVVKEVVQPEKRKERKYIANVDDGNECAKFSPSNITYVDLIDDSDDNEEEEENVECRVIKRPKRC